MILVTGSTGINGIEIVRLLSRVGVRCRALVRNPQKAAIFYLESKSSRALRRGWPKGRRSSSASDERPNHGSASLLVALIGGWTNNYAIYRSS